MGGLVSSVGFVGRGRKKKARECCPRHDNAVVNRLRKGQAARKRLWEEEWKRLSVGNHQNPGMEVVVGGEVVKRDETRQ